MDPNNLSNGLAVLQGQGYITLLIIMIFEGPIITAVGAFAASLGFFNVYVIFALSLIGNIVGDMIYYFIGRIGRKSLIDRYFEKFGMKKDWIDKLEKQLKKNPGKILTVIKVIPPLPTPGLILAGATKLEFRIFIFYSFIVSFLFSLFFTVLGYYVGAAFIALFKYSNYFIYGVVGIIIITVLILWLYNKYTKRFYEKISKIK